MGDGPALMQLLLVGRGSPISRAVPGNLAALISNLTGFNSKPETPGDHRILGSGSKSYQEVQSWDLSLCSLFWEMRHGLAVTMYAQCSGKSRNYTHAHTHERS